MLQVEKSHDKRKRANLQRGGRLTLESRFLERAQSVGGLSQIFSNLGFFENGCQHPWAFYHWSVYLCTVSCDPLIVCFVACVVISGFELVAWLFFGVRIFFVPGGRCFFD